MSELHARAAAFDPQLGPPVPVYMEVTVKPILCLADIS